MTPLMNKMTEDLRLRNLSNKTSVMYLGCVRRFGRHHGLSPDQLGSEDVRGYLLTLEDLGRAASTRGVYYAALRFFYDVTMENTAVMAAVPCPRVPNRGALLPLTHAEVRALLRCFVKRPFDYTFFATMLATGVRISECCALTVRDIDRRARLIHIRDGKGEKSRSVMLSNKHLRLLERYWRVEKLSGKYLFPAQRRIRPGVVDVERRWATHAVSSGTMGQRLRDVVAGAGLRRRVTSHDLRRTFASWLYEQCRDLLMVQVLLGHTSPATTVRYTSLHPNIIAATSSPYDQL